MKKQATLSNCMLVLLTLILFVFIMTVNANAGTFYVATNGNNSNGSDWTKAYTTIQAAVTAASSGDIIIVGSSGTGHGDGIYTENVNVTKSLTIRSENGYATTTVHESSGYHIFEITADNVTIDGFSIYGATNNEEAGIFLDKVTGCTIENNRCGWDTEHKNYHGIYLDSSSNNTVSDDTCSSNEYGIFLSSSSNNNTVSDNTCSSNNYHGILLKSSSNNTVTGNTCSSNSNHGIRLFNNCNNNVVSGNICRSNADNGIYLSSSSNNTLSDNTCSSSKTYDGILLDSSSGNNTVTGNTANSNYRHGIHLVSSSNNTVYLNNFSGNSGGNVYSEGSTNTWNSPTTIYYDYTSGSFHKNYLGNYYSDYRGSDGNEDGIGDTDYTGPVMTDSYPLMASSDHYSLQAWWLHSYSKMYRDDMTKSYGSVTITANGSHIWIADQAALTNISFSGSAGWTGQIVFTSAPASGDNFTIEMGSSTNGADFNTGGPDATITGDGTDSVFTYETDASAFTVTTGNYLALRITNNSGTAYDVQTGGAWSYCSSPESSTDYSLPVELTSFTATPGAGIITISWITESEVENLGFNIYRSTNPNGEFLMLNAELIPGAGSSSQQHEYEYVDKDVKNDVTYWYKLENVDFSGKAELHGPVSAIPMAKAAPSEFCLHPSYPNPFNPVTTISYELPEDVHVDLSVYNMLGEKVATLCKSNQRAGFYSLSWDGRNQYGDLLSSGIYFLRISAGSYYKTNKIIFIR